MMGTGHKRGCLPVLITVQGQRFERQTDIWRSARRDGKIELSKAQAGEFLEPESQTLEERYRPRKHSATSPIIVPGSHNSENIRLILERCRQFADVNFSSTQLQEEQERQLAPEIEQERQVQRPLSAKPEIHSIHADLRAFICTGTLIRPSQAFIPAFQGLTNTSATKHLSVTQFPADLLVTRDFVRTVQISGGVSSILDDYQRPVQWVLTSSATGSGNKRVVKHMVIISPYEANKLKSDILVSSTVAMHLYAPRQNRGYSPLDGLDLYTFPTSALPVNDIPTTLRIQLNLFAGQLYISSFDEYREVCNFLGLASTTTIDGMIVAADGFIQVAANSKKLSTFKSSSLKFLRVLMSQIRRDGQEIDKTHLGNILDGKLLSIHDF